MCDYAFIADEEIKKKILNTLAIAIQLRNSSYQITMQSPCCAKLDKGDNWHKAARWIVAMVEATDYETVEDYLKAAFYCEAMVELGYMTRVVHQDILDLIPEDYANNEALKEVIRQSYKNLDNIPAEQLFKD